MKYYIAALKKYATFSGRSRRSEYWYFVLFNFFASILAVFIDRALGTTFNVTDLNGDPVFFPYGYIYFIYAIFTLIPSLAVTIRRLHDVGKSGWFIFIILIPFVGAIWLLVLFFTDSKFGPNQYGANPKGIGNTDEIDQIGIHLAP